MLCYVNTESLWLVTLGCLYFIRLALEVVYHYLATGMSLSLLTLFFIACVSDTAAVCEKPIAYCVHRMHSQASWTAALCCLVLKFFFV